MAGSAPWPSQPFGWSTDASNPVPWPWPVRSYGWYATEKLPSAVADVSSASTVSADVGVNLFADAISVSAGVSSTDVGGGGSSQSNSWALLTVVSKADVVSASSASSGSPLDAPSGSFSDVWAVLTPRLAADVRSDSTPAATYTTQVSPAAVAAANALSDSTVGGVLRVATGGKAVSDSNPGGALEIKPGTPVTVSNIVVAQAATVALPAHSPGDLIVVWAYNYANSFTAVATAAAVPTQPAAGGTIPTFTTLSANPGTINNLSTQAASGNFNTVAVRVSYAVATASNHTIGTWTGSLRTCAAVISGTVAPHIGGYAEAGFASALTAGRQMTIPGITLNRADNTSLVLACAASTTNNATTGFPIVQTYTAPPGYTEIFQLPHIWKKDLTLDAPATYYTQLTTTTNGAVGSRHTGRQSHIEFLSGLTNLNEQTFTFDTPVANAEVDIPSWVQTVDVAAIGGGMGGSNGALVLSAGGEGGRWSFGTIDITALTAGLNVTRLFARYTVGRGGAGAPGGILAAAPGLPGDFSRVSIIAKLNNGSEQALAIFTGAQGSDPAIVVNSIGGRATGGNVNPAPLPNGRDVLLNGLVWTGGDLQNTPSATGFSPGAGGAGGGFFGAGGNGANGGVRMRFLRRSVSELSGLVKPAPFEGPPPWIELDYTDAEANPPDVWQGINTGIVVTTNDDGETLYDGMTMAEIEALIERLVDERVAATVAAADANSLKYTKEQIQAVLDAMNGPDATLESVTKMFWMLNDILEALIVSAGIELP